MKRITWLATLLLLAALPVAAAAQQQGTVQGTVTDATTMQPLSGVQVTVPGTSAGTLTNAQGRFQLIAVPAGPQNIRVSLIGYATQTQAVNVAAGGSSTADFSLDPTALTLEGVVVTALGLERQARSLGIAADAFAGETLTQAEPNVVSSLSGRVAGVNITSSGAQGGSARMVIRGENSITGNNQPLWVIDGIPVDNYNATAGINADQGGFDYGNAVQDINPDAIESITVLKGPNAAALYGSRASNGAVIITTKKGNEALGGAQITASQLITFEDELRLPDYQDEYGQGALGLFEYYDGDGGGLFDEYDESWGPPLDEGLMIPQFNSPIDPATGERRADPWVSRPDNVDQFFDLGRTLSTNLSVATATDRLNGRFGFTRLDQDGMVPGFELQRNTFTFGGGMDVSDRLNITTSVQYVDSEGENRPGIGYGEDNPMSQFVWFGRQVDVEYLEDNYDEIRPPEDPMAGLPVSWNYHYHPNPYYLQISNRNFDTRDRLIGMVSTSYQVTPWLNAMVRTGTDWYQDARTKTYAPDNFGGLYTTNPLDASREPVAATGAFGIWNIGFQETNSDFLLSANPATGLPFTSTFTVGGSRRDSERRHDYTWVGELATPGIFNVQNAAVPALPFVREFNRRVNSLYGQAEFGYNNYLFLTVSGRNDWSSTLPEEHRSFFYPSVSGSFVFSDVFSGLQNTPLNFGKLRASWARVGTDTEPYQLINTLIADEVYEGLPTFSLPARLANAELRPEITESWEIGTELAFFADRVGLDLTYYNELTSDQIMPVQISRATGYQERMLNAGAVRNKGWEALLRLNPIRTNDFRWETSFTFADNSSVVEELAEGIEGLEISLGDFWGVSVYANEGEPYGQLVGTAYRRNAAGQRLVSASGSGLPLGSTTPQVLGNFNPDWRGSWSNDLSYRGINLNFLLDTRQGGNVYSVTQMFGRYSGVLEETAGRGRCVTQDEFDTLAGAGRTSHYPLCTAQTGVIAPGFKTVITGSDTTYVENDVPISGQTWFLYGSYLIPEANIIDASYVKLREATLSYTLPATLTDRIGLASAQLSLIGRNLMLWTPDSNPHIDPETAPDATNVQGFEYGQMPTPRTLGINITVRP